MSLTEIKTAIIALTEVERAELGAWLLDLPTDEWDRQMMRDAQPGGKLDVLARENCHKR